jgi:PAS domain S-box-containing protein
LPEVGRLFIENNLQALNATSGHILLLDYQNGRLENLVAVNLPVTFEAPTLNQNTLLIETVKNRQPAFIPTLIDHNERPEVKAALEAAGVHAFACLPLWVHDQVLGLFFVNYRQPHYFSDYEKELLSIFANQAAAAILNARTAERQQAARQILESLVYSARVINSQTELSAVLQTLAERVVEILRRPACSVCLLDESGKQLIGRASVGMSYETTVARLTVGRGFLGTVAATGQRRQIYDLLETEFRDSPVRKREGWRSGISLPLKYNEKIIGTLAVYGYEPGYFTDNEVTLLEGIAEQACIAINNTAMFEEARHQREKYQALLENASDAIFLLLPDSGIILEANLRASEMTGYPNEKLSGLEIVRLFDKTESQRVDKILRRLGGNPLPGGSVNLEDVNLRCADGSSRIVSFSARLVEIGNTRLIIQIMRDMTERRAMEQELVRVEQLRALGQLASGVAHDFNNLLTGILGISELVLAEMDENGEQRRLIEVIRQSALDGAQMVRRIQYLGRRNQAEAYTEIDLNQLVQDVIELTRPRWRSQTSQRGTHLELIVATAQVPPIWGSAPELREVLTNLIFNAVDAMPDGGELSLETGIGAGQVWVKVSDTGLGMTEETRQRLFEPFYTTKQQDGHGLGLSVSWSIINRHGGTIEVDSQLNQGTSFTVKLPPARAQSPAVAPPLPELEACAPRRLFTLIVDDEPNLIYVLTRILESLGHSVTAALSGQEALQTLENNPQKFDIVFTDLSIPDIVGWEVARRARQISPQVKIVLVTGWGAGLDQHQLQEAQIDMVINKPYRVRDIQSALAALMEQG